MKKLTLRRNTIRALGRSRLERAKGGWYNSTNCQEECSYFRSGCHTASDVGSEVASDKCCDGD